MFRLNAFRCFCLFGWTRQVCVAPLAGVLSCLLFRYCIRLKFFKPAHEKRMVLSKSAGARFVASGWPGQPANNYPCCSCADPTEPGKAWPVERQACRVPYKVLEMPKLRTSSRAAIRWGTPTFSSPTFSSPKVVVRCCCCCCFSAKYLVVDIVV